MPQKLIQSRPVGPLHPILSSTYLLDTEAPEALTGRPSKIFVDRLALKLITKTCLTRLPAAGLRCSHPLARSSHRSASSAACRTLSGRPRSRQYAESSSKARIVSKRAANRK